MEENRESGHIEKQLAYPSKKEAYARGSPSTNVLLSGVGKYRSISLEAEIVERLKEQETRERAETQNQ